MGGQINVETIQEVVESLVENQSKVEERTITKKSSWREEIPRL
jgi:hypothetical protein